MKKIKYLIMMILAIMALKAESQTYLVIDTTVQNNIKLRIIEKRLQQMESDLVTVFDREKVLTDTMTYLSQVKNLFNYFNSGLDQFKSLFYRYDSINYIQVATDPFQIYSGQEFTFDFFIEGGDPDQIGLINEWDLLNRRIIELQTDSTITHLNYLQEFKDLQLRKEILLNRYNQINSQL